MTEQIYGRNHKEASISLNDDLATRHPPPRPNPFSKIVSFSVFDKHNAAWKNILMKNRKYAPEFEKSSRDDDVYISRQAIHGFPVRIFLSRLE
ncbi:hypothetical protein DPMN_051742 [Dreissena polymorpha]|uniref:Uncharacterized protein n=1 Tax=Dreissena polymorpha TaxID=45954 RepID=A0A9D4HNM4_DREPO|nr:hypothetical protein DPMN_051742 [Dreissena polymorpha]